MSAERKSKTSRFRVAGAATRAAAGADAVGRAVGGVRVAKERAGSLASPLASLMVIGGWAVVGAGGAASPASAHTAGVAIPPENDYMIRWHQPHSVRPVDDWEIEVTPVANPARRFIATAQVVPEASCWALNVPVAEPAQVRVRSVVGTQVSSWTRATVVPEPGLGAGVAAATGALALLARRARRGRARTD